MKMQQIKRRGCFGWFDRTFPAIVRRYPGIALRIKALEEVALDCWVAGKMRARVDALSRNRGNIFSMVEIETHNRCNGLCGFCPVNAKSDPRPYLRMSDNMFFDIIRQLAECNYSGRLSIFSNNEPLLDKRIVDFYRYAREKLPGARLALFTNGTLMDRAKLDSLCALVDLLVIDNYSIDGSLNDQVADLAAFMQQSPERYQQVEINIIRTDAFRDNRAGTAPNGMRGVGLRASCLLPFIQCVIRPDGKLSLCCEDALGRYTMGDLTQNSLLDIWGGPEYERIRVQIRKGRHTLPLCKGCNSYWSLDFVR